LEAGAGIELANLNKMLTMAQINEIFDSMQRLRASFGTTIAATVRHRQQRPMSPTLRHHSAIKAAIVCPQSRRR